MDQHLAGSVDFGKKPRLRKQAIPLTNYSANASKINSSKATPFAEPVFTITRHRNPFRIIHISKAPSKDQEALAMRNYEETCSASAP